MTTFDDALVRYTDHVHRRPIPAAFLTARQDVLAVAADLASVADATLGRPWGWKGGSEEELRYGAYRIAELFERAGIDAAETMRVEGIVRGRTADLIAPTAAAHWDLQGLLAPLADALWDADPGGGEWTIRQTLGHTVGGQRGYGVGTAWWQAQDRRMDDPELGTAPEALWDALPSEDEEGAGTPAEVRERSFAVLDATVDRLAGLPEDRLHRGARWAGFAVDIGFRIGRWSSHIREHAIQVDKTLVALGHQPTEVDRLVRNALARWGEAEAAVLGLSGDDATDPVGIVAAAAAEARSTAAELVGLARG